MKKRLVTLLCSAVIALSSLTSMTAQAAQVPEGITVDLSEASSSTSATDTASVTPTTSTVDYASLIARQDFITLSGLTQGVWGQTYNIRVSCRDIGKSWRQDDTAMLLEPVITDLGNGWTTAMIALYSPQLNLGELISYQLVDSISGYTYNTTMEYLSFDEACYLTNYGDKVYGNQVIANTPVAGTRDTAYTVYSTATNNKVDRNLHWIYLKYPTGMTGLTICLESGDNGADDVTHVGQSLAEHPAQANSYIYFKIN
jgi:hypothetical protein